MSSVPPPPPPSSPTPCSPPRKRARTTSPHSTHPTVTAAAIASAVDKATVSSIGSPAVTIDAFRGERGGQIVRTALSLSALLDLSVQLNNIREHLPEPGLSTQHVLEAKTIALIAGAVQAGVRVGSRSICMGVGIGYEGNAPIEALVENAGPVSLVLLAALPVVLRQMGVGNVLNITGATCVQHAPVSEYVRQVMVPNLRAFGVDLKYEIEKEGFFPTGGGRVKVALGSLDTEDGCLRSVTLSERGQILSIAGKLVVCGREFVTKKIVDAMIMSVVNTFKHAPGTRMNFFPALPKNHIVVEDLSHDNTSTKCICLTLHAKTSCGTALGASVVWSGWEDDSKLLEGSQYSQSERSKWSSLRKHAEALGALAAKELIKALRSDGVVDEHMAHQMIIYMSMARGVSTVLFAQMTSHMKSIIDVCRKFGAMIHVSEVYDGHCKVTVVGQAVKLLNA